MPRVYLSEKEASAIVVLVEDYMMRYPHSCTCDIVAKVPARIARCIEMQGKKKATDRKARD